VVRRIVLPPPAAEPKSEAQQAEELQRVIAFQKEQAAVGKASSQYDLGLRYLKGDGVAQDPEAARKWLAAAAGQGHEEARQKLRQLDGTLAGKQ
jgi:hypothetical protein